MSHSLTFAYDGLTIRVDAPDTALMEWLREFLTPAFTVVQGVAPDHTVELIADDGAYAAVLRRGACAGDPSVDCFTLDSGIVRLPLWASSDGQRVIFDRARRVFYEVSSAGRRVRIITALGNLAARFALMSVVREFAMTAAQSDQSAVIHGAALGGPGGGIIIAGPKGAGKTTVLLHALQQQPALWFVSNDRVVVDIGAARPTLRGMPTVVSIRPGTFELFPAFARRLLDSGFDHRRALDEVPPVSARTAPPRTDAPVDLSPAQLCRLLGVHMHDRSTLRALVFVRVAGETSGPPLRELPAAEATSRLTEALFARGSGSVTSKVFGTPARRSADRGTLEAVCRILVGGVRSFHYQPGPDFGTGTASVAELTKLVQGSPAPSDVTISPSHAPD